MLREVWLNIGVEKVDTHEGVTVKALLDSSTTGIFIDKSTAAKHEFKLQKLEKLEMWMERITVEGLLHTR